MPSQNPVRRLLAATLLLAIAGAPLGAFAQQPKGKAEAAAGASCSANLKGSAPMKVKLTTSMGAITVELDKAKAPVSTENFVKYVDSGHYNGTIFHRVIDGFMIQGGGFTRDMQQKPTQAPIKNEAANGLKNDMYTLAMARELHPGKRNSLDALCERYQVDNSRRSLHGALLDAQLLADVWLAMTRGQDTLDISLAASALPGEGGQAAERPARLVVVRASEAEIAAHAAMCERIDKESKGRCLWKQAAGPA